MITSNNSIQLIAAPTSKVLKPIFEQVDKTAHLKHENDDGNGNNNNIYSFRMPRMFVSNARYLLDSTLFISTRETTTTCYQLYLSNADIHLWLFC